MLAHLPDPKHCDCQTCTMFSSLSRERDEARQMAIDSHVDAVKAVAQELKALKERDDFQTQAGGLKRKLFEANSRAEKAEAARDEAHGRARNLCALREAAKDVDNSLYVANRIEGTIALEKLHDALQKLAPCRHAAREKALEEALQEALCYVPADQVEAIRRRAAGGK